MLSFFAGIILPNRTDSQGALFKVKYGANLTLDFDVIATPRPTVEWFQDGAKIVSGVSLTMLELKNADNSTFYRFKLYKNITNENDTGFYEAFVVFGNIRFSMINYSVTIEGKVESKNSTPYMSCIYRY